MGGKMLPTVLLVGVGCLGLVAAAQWQRRLWLGSARWLARQTSPHLLVGIPTASIHLTPSRAKKSGMTIMKNISDIWP